MAKRAHRVRTHIRKTKHGQSSVRAHTRGSGTKKVGSKDPWKRKRVPETVVIKGKTYTSLTGGEEKTRTRALMEADSQRRSGRNARVVGRAVYIRKRKK